jgi:hypothetical protein
VSLQTYSVYLAALPHAQQAPLLRLECSPNLPSLLPQPPPPAPGGAGGPRELSMRVVLSRGALVTAAEGRVLASHQDRNSLSPGMGCSRLPVDEGAAGGEGASGTAQEEKLGELQ